MNLTAPRLRRAQDAEDGRQLPDVALADPLEVVDEARDALRVRRGASVPPVYSEVHR